MKKGFFILTLLISFTGCDYREYPQEEEWKEEFQEKQEEMDSDEREINFTPGNT